MTCVAELVARLISAGIPAELAASVVTEAFVAGVNSSGNSSGNRLDKIRAADRERKRRDKISGGIPVEFQRNDDEVLTLTSLPLKKNSEVKKVRKTVSPKIAIPAEWQPANSHFEAAAKLGIAREKVLAKAEDMRIWAGANGARKVDWDLTFHGFLRRDAEKLKGHANGKTLVAAADRLLDKLDEFNRPAPEPQRLRGPEGAVAIRAIPEGRRQ